MPFRWPLRESPQFFSARASWSRPVLNASFEHCAHQGAAGSWREEDSQTVFGTSGVSFGAGRREILEPSQTSGSYFRPTTRSFIGISALSVILMCSGQTSVQHLVMLQ